MLLEINLFSRKSKYFCAGIFSGSPPSVMIQIIFDGASANMMFNRFSPTGGGANGKDPYIGILLRNRAILDFSFMYLQTISEH